jgi:hypothetical protein
MTTQPHPGPDVPHRTSRSRALEIGTDPQGFSETLYCPQCGQPLNTGLPHSHYKEQGPNVAPGANAVPAPQAFEVK